MKKTNKSFPILKRKLNYHYKFFDFSQISPDPIEFPHRYSNWHDIEISAFISSVFAYGNVKQILKTLEILHEKMGESPLEFILNYELKLGKKLFADTKHRFYTSQDIIDLFMILSKIYQEYGSLKYLFLMYHFNQDENLKSSISFFSRNFLALKKGDLSPGLKFMVADPYKGSACKRMNMFLRWMIRKDELDFGLWEEIAPSKLVIPIDTHVEQICRKLKLTKRKTVSWKMAEEITENLKLFNAEDPVKYDFAICHIGMRGLNF